MIFFTQPPPRPSDAMIGDRFSRRDEFLASLEEVLKLVSVFSLGGLFPSSPVVNFSCSAEHFNNPQWNGT